MILDFGLEEGIEPACVPGIRNPKSKMALSSPLQFISQNIEVVSVRGADEIECRSALSDADAIVCVHRVADLSVECEYDTFVFLFKFELYHRVVRDDDNDSTIVLPLAGVAWTTAKGKQSKSTSPGEKPSE